MLDFQRIIIDHFVEELRNAYRRTYSNLEPQYVNIIGWSARLALGNITNSDALYHNVEHTIMVTLAGQAILEGKHLKEGGVSPKDWLQFLIALLCHDIGYVRGVCRKDQLGLYSTGIKDEMVEISTRGTDVLLTPYHVDRSKQFVRERFGE
ncbi:MAG: metal-dependent phosphohydrolase, partial [Chloroflexota bacterium]